MAELKSFKEMVNKTIKKVLFYEGEKLIIQFHEGDYIAIMGGCLNDEEPFVTVFSPYLPGALGRKMVSEGIIDPEVVKQLQEEEKSKRKESERYEYLRIKEEFLRLKKTYEPD